MYIHSFIIVYIQKSNMSESEEDYGIFQLRLNKDREELISALEKKLENGSRSEVVEEALGIADRFLEKNQDYREIRGYGFNEK